MAQWVITCSQESPPVLVVGVDSLSMDCPNENLIVVPADKFGLGSLLNISVSDAVELSSLAMVLWAIVWGIKRVAQTLQETDHEKLD